MKDGVVILVQNELMPKKEFEGLGKSEINFSISRVNISNKIVIPRYGALPFYKELERDLDFQNSSLINTYKQHLYVANFEYYKDVEKYTPKTYFSYVDLPENCKVVVKGVTNSKKLLWNTNMLANNKKQALTIMNELKNDMYLQNQEIIFREFEKLEILEYGINELPFANEWRFFYYKKNLIDYGYYWTIAETRPKFDQESLIFANKIADIIGKNINFFVLDVAKLENGQWILIEVNDGCMSGLADIEPVRFYQNLKKAVFQNKKKLF